MGLEGYGRSMAIGSMKSGARGSIADVAGVKVGHCTLSEGAIQTGVTAILPQGGNIFREKVVAASHVINGFGKSVGLVQIDELGSVETPILLTNTLSVGTCSTALVRYMLERDPDIGLGAGSVNPVVCECNDGWLNDIRGLHVREEHVRSALSAASDCFDEGAVGAGRGMRCFGLKGGIGTASRVFRLDDGECAVGALVLTNFGSLERLILDGDPVGRRLAGRLAAAKGSPAVEGAVAGADTDAKDSGAKDAGSIIVILATDAPMDARQLGRLCRRAGVGMARTGSYFGNGSGDIVLAFSTANRIEHCPASEVRGILAMHENSMDKAFLAAAESVEEAIVSSLMHAETTTGRDGHRARGLSELIGKTWRQPWKP